MALTKNQRAFAIKVAEGGNQTAAYRATYNVSGMADKTIRSAASALAANAAVSVLISGLTAGATVAATRKIGIKLEDSLKNAAEGMEFAKQVGQAGAFVAAATLHAKLSGHLVDKKEVRTGPLEETDVSDLVKMRDQVRGRMTLEQEAEELAGGGSVAPVFEGNRPQGRTLQ